MSKTIDNIGYGIGFIVLILFMSWIKDLDKDIIYYIVVTLIGSLFTLIGILLENTNKLVVEEK